MQVYVGKGGQQYGPYTVGQLRQYVEAGNFAPTDYACHDRANWVTIAQVPGFAPAVGKTVPKQVEKPAEKPHGKLCLIIGIAVLMIVIFSVGLYFAMSGDDAAVRGPQRGIKKASAAPAAPDLFDLTPEALVDVYDGDTFKVDLEGVHPLFGDDLSIRVNGIDAPEIRGSEDRVRALAEQARDMTKKLLRGAKRIELRNPQRGKYFRIVADVYLDGESLAKKLKAAGLAKNYDGEGKKPEW